MKTQKKLFLKDTVKRIKRKTMDQGENICKPYKTHASKYIPVSRTYKELSNEIMKQNN